MVRSSVLGQTTTSRDEIEALAWVLALVVLVLYVLMIVKFFQIASDVRLMKDMMANRRLEELDAVIDDVGGVAGSQEFTSDVARLRELGKLRDEGLLTEREFLRLKAELLGTSDPSNPDPPPGRAG